MEDSHRETVASGLGETGPEAERAPEPDRVPELLRLGDRLLLSEVVGLSVWPPPEPTSRKNRKIMECIAKLGRKGGETQRLLQGRDTSIANTPVVVN